MRAHLPAGVLTMIVSTTCFVALLITYLVSNQAGNQVASAWVGEVTIEASSNLSAGQTASVTVQADADDGTEVQVALFAPLSTNVFLGIIEDRQAVVEVESVFLEHAGLYRIVAQVDGSPSLAHDLIITPLTAVDPVVPLIGPRTIIADGSDFTMSVVSPIDRFGNPVIDGTAVEFDLVRPDGERTIITEPVDRGLAALLIESSTEAGRMIVSASVGDSDGPSNTVDQVAGVPAPFTVQADERNTLADGFTLHDVQTSQLRDVFGNILPDGVAAVFVIDDGENISLIQSTIQGGVARAGIESPATPTELTVSARISGAESAPLAVRFDAAVTEVPVAITERPSGINIAIGPVVTERGGYVADGTTATISDPSTGDLLGSVDLRSGIASVELDGVSLPIEVTVLGANERAGAS